MADAKIQRCLHSELEPPVDSPIGSRRSIKGNLEARHIAAVIALLNCL